MNNNFTKFLAVRLIDDSENMLAYSEISGRLYVPIGQPTLFNNINEIRSAVKRTKEHLCDSNPVIAKRTKFIVFKLNFSEIKV